MSAPAARWSSRWSWLDATARRAGARAGNGGSALQFDIVWQLAGLGIVVIVVHSVFKTAGREELAWLTSLAGLGLFMILVLQIVGRLFQAVRTTFGM